MGKTKVGEVASFDNGVRVWAGMVADPFTGNGAGIGPLKSAALEGRFAADAFAQPGNLLKGLSVVPLLSKRPIPCSLEPFFIL